MISQLFSTFNHRLAPRQSAGLAHKRRPTTPTLSGSPGSSSLGFSFGSFNRGAKR